MEMCRRNEFTHSYIANYAQWLKYGATHENAVPRPEKLIVYVSRPRRAVIEGGTRVRLRSAVLW